MIFKYLPFLIAAIALSGCKGDDDAAELKAYIEGVHERDALPIDPLPVIRTPPRFEYSAIELKDPFAQVKALVEQEPVEVVSGPKPDFERPREELEEYELDSLRMVGTLELAGERWGLVTSPDGIIHKVQPGNYAGTNHGRIVRIDEEQIELVELVELAPGRYNEREAELAVTN